MNQAHASATLAKITKDIASRTMNVGVIVMNGKSKLMRIGMENNAKHTPINDTK